MNSRNDNFMTELESRGTISQIYAAISLQRWPHLLTFGAHVKCVPEFVSRLTKYFAF